MKETEDAENQPQETGKNENSITETPKIDDQNAENNEPETRPNEWMIRTSATYKDEYKECKSILGRFHQYFIFGEMLDCSQWKADLENSKEWEANRSEEAYNKLVESERERRRQRLQGHISNNIWEKRESPPEEWKNPLPEWMAKNLERTYLSLKAAENEQPKLGANTLNSCVIL